MNRTQRSKLLHFNSPTPQLLPQTPAKWKWKISSLSAKKKQNRVKHHCSSMMRTSRLLRSRNSTPSSSVPDSPRSLDSRINVRARPSLMMNHRPSVVRGSGASSAGYESDDSLKFERSNHLAMAQDVMSIKTMLLKLKRVLHEVRHHYSHCRLFCFLFSVHFCMLLLLLSLRFRHIACRQMKKFCWG